MVMIALMFIHSMLPSEARVRFISLGKAFGVPRFQIGLHSLCAKGTILTCNILMKRGIMLVDWWSTCRCSSEIILMLHCDIAYALWTIVFCVFGIQQVMPKRVIDL